jgi:PAS domain S-box-containing protein
MRQYYWLDSSPTSFNPTVSSDSPLSPDLSNTWVCLEQSTDVSVDLENLRRQHQLILNAIGEGVYGVDLQGNATFVNPAGAQMIGWEIHELIGKSMHDVLHHSKLDHTPYPTQTCPIYAAFKDGAVHRVTDEIFWRKDGTSFPVEYISTPMRDEQGNLIGAVVTFQDITQRKWAETVLHHANEELELKVRERTAELYQANEQLKELSELRSRVVSTVCHEFRNPLNNILLSVSSLGRYDTHLSAEQKENYLLGIKENVERMTQMIDAILVIGKVEAKRIEVQPSQVELVQFCRNLVCEINYSSNRHQIEFICRSKAISATLDEKLLRSILTNILSNSVQYSSPQSSIQFRLSRQKQQVIFQVKDRGIGIPPEDQPYLFEPFHRGRNVSNIPGTGLGLNIVKRFVDLQQGKVEVESQLGIGTTFTVVLDTARHSLATPEVVE